MTLGISGRNPTGCAGTAATTRSGACFKRFQMNGPPMQKHQHHELVDAQMIHQTELVIGIGIPRPVDFERAGRLAGIGVAQVRVDAAVLALELLDRVEGAAR